MGRVVGEGDLVCVDRIVDVPAFKEWVRDVELDVQGAVVVRRENPASLRVSRGAQRHANVCVDGCRIVGGRYYASSGFSQHSFAKASCREVSLAYLHSRIETCMLLRP